jgi:hypothetical protein
VNSFSWPRLASGTLPTYQTRPKSSPVLARRDWAMLKHLGWMATSAIFALLVWQAVAAETFLPRVVSDLLMAAISLLVGLRIGANSADAYLKDLQRNNKVLADQQRDLEEMNEMLLKQINSASSAHSRSAVESGHVSRPK